LIITSGDIGFDGRKFVFRPPTLPRQLALSDVRKAGFVADRVRAVVEGEASVDVEDAKSENVMTIKVDVGGKQVGYERVEGVGSRALGRGDVDPFDVLKPTPVMTPITKDFGLSLGLGTPDYSRVEEAGGGRDGEEVNNYSFLDSPFTFEQLGGIDGGQGVYLDEEGGGIER